MTELSSIMMVTFNRLSLTKQMMESFVSTTHGNYELVIVDNNSTDGTVEFLNSFKENNANVKLILNKENKGIAIARNQALLAAQGIWLSTVDNDVILPDNWLNNCIEIIKANPKYAMIGVNFEKQDYPLVELNNKVFQRKPKGNLGTACTVFNRSLHKMLGFFNHLDYGKYGLEDSDWGMRVRVLGLELGYLKENGTHLGEGENDTGEYRKFKTKTHDEYLKKFNENCRLYVNNKKSIYIPFNI